MINKPPRLKDGLKQEEWDNLDEGLKKFYDDFSNKFGYAPVVTSGARSKTFKTKNSHHLSGEAIDLRYDKQLVNDLYNTKEGLALLTQYNLGMLDESTPEALEKTGGTGAHLHIGRDSALVKQAKEKFSTFDGTAQIPTQSITQQFQEPTTFEVVQGAGTPQETYDQFLKELAIKEQEENKVEGSSARQEVEQKKEVVSKQQQFLQAFANATAPIQENQTQPQQQMQRVQPLMQQSSVGIQTVMPEMQSLFKQGGTMSFNTQEEYQKGLTGAPQGTTGVFNYQNAEEREFIRTDRDLKLFADGREIGVLDKNNPSLIVPPSYQVIEKEFQDGGKYIPQYQDGTVINTEVKPVISPSQATIDWMNANPMMEGDKPYSLDKFELTKVTGYPTMVNGKIFVPGAGTYGSDDYKLLTPEGYGGYPVYDIRGKHIAVDEKNAKDLKEFNKEFFNMYKYPKLFGKDELTPVYGRGTPYLP